MSRPIFIYGYATAGHVHYVGSTTNLKARDARHHIKRRLPFTAALVHLATTSEVNGFSVEGEVIAQLKRIGQCELNKHTPANEPSIGINGRLSDGAKDCCARSGFAPMAGMLVPILILKKRIAFGRHDYQITPQHGTGTKWIASNRIIKNPKQTTRLV